MQIRTNAFSQAVEKKDLEVCKFKYKNNISLEEVINWLYTELRKWALIILN